MRKKIGNGIFAAQGRLWLALLATLFVSVCGYKTNVRAAENSFVMEAELMAGGDGSTYDIRVTVQNNGGDWEGTVRFMMEDGYKTPCAYDTDMALPGGGRKQFTVKIPVDSIEDAKRGSAYMVLLDESGRQVADKAFPRFLDDGADALLMGILSDDYTSLTYLDMGGEELYYYDDEYPVRLVELDQDNLAEYLDTLTMLVIDQYSTEVLTDEDMEAIRYWNEDGGVLIVGTGAYAEETLGGFDKDYLGVNSAGVYPPGEGRHSPAIPEQALSLNMENLTLAELQTSQPVYEVHYYNTTGILVCSWAKGAVAVLPYALTELGKLDEKAYDGSDRTSYVYSLLQEISSFSAMRYRTSSGNPYDFRYMTGRLFGILSNSSDAVNLGVLKVIVIAYVIFVGPVLYLILKLIKKRELYWVTVPVSALLGIGLIYLAGRGFEVKNTKVYSIVMTDLTGREGKRAYLQCFDAGHDEWQMKLSGDYEYIGPLNSSSYGSDGSLKYYHHFKTGADGIYFGIKPSSSFESGFFCAGRADAGKERGSVDLSVVQGGRFGLSGTVVNKTDCDFKNFALVVDNVMYVYDALPAGESIELADMDPLYQGPPSYEYSYSSMLRMRYSSGEEVDAQAAIGIGICAEAESVLEADIFFIGVTENSGKTVDDICDEISYECFYTISALKQPSDASLQPDEGGRYALY